MAAGPPAVVTRPAVAVAGGAAIATRWISMKKTLKIYHFDM
jgi:hypothetical protein